MYEELLQGGTFTCLQKKLLEHQEAAGSLVSHGLWLAVDCMVKKLLSKLVAAKH